MAANARIDDPRPLPPERPADNACCDSGCDPCVYDLYARELEDYRAALRAWEERQELPAQAGAAAKSSEA